MVIITTATNDYSIRIGDNASIIILVCVGLFASLLVCCMCLLFIYCHKRRKKIEDIRIRTFKDIQIPKRNATKQAPNHVINNYKNNSTKGLGSGVHSNRQINNNINANLPNNLPHGHKENDQEISDSSIENLYADVNDPNDKTLNTCTDKNEQHLQEGEELYFQVEGNVASGEMSNSL